MSEHEKKEKKVKDSAEMKILEKANDLQEFCRSRDGVCTDCMFVRNESDCALMSDLPRNWDI